MEANINELSFYALVRARLLAHICARAMDMLTKLCANFQDSARARAKIYACARKIFRDPAILSRLVLDLHLTPIERNTHPNRNTKNQLHQDSQPQTHRHRHRDTRKHSQTNKQTHTHRITDTADTDTDRQTQTHTDTHRHTQTHTDTHRHTQTHTYTQKHT